MSDNEVVERTRKRLLDGPAYLHTNTLDKNKIAFWLIRGEDTNPDFSGSHFRRPLKVMYCRYEKAVEVALKTPGFFCWGYGGDVEEIEGEIDVYPNTDYVTV